MSSFYKNKTIIKNPLQKNIYTYTQKVNLNKIIKYGN